MKERLHKLIKEKTSNKLENRDNKQGTYNVREIAKIIRKELNCFKQKVRGKYLDLIYKYLLTIRPTSVEAERAFSAAGLLSYSNEKCYLYKVNLCGKINRCSS